MRKETILVRKEEKADHMRKERRERRTCKKGKMRKENI
jgi:hypothetical protein